MADRSDDPNKKALVHFAGDWLPAHEVWKKMETVTTVVEKIDRFNSKFPELANENTRDVVPLVRKRMKDMGVRLPYKGSQAEIAKLIVELLQRMSPEDVLDELERSDMAELDITQMIQLGGNEAYIDALTREAHELHMNRVSPEQTAQLWNDIQRPSPGGGMWTAKKVSEIIDGHG